MSDLEQDNVLFRQCNNHVDKKISHAVHPLARFANAGSHRSCIRQA